MLALVPHVQRGVTLIELVIGIAIVGILLAAGLPSFGNWIQSTQIRTAAEAIQNGLQLARMEAVRRNNSVQFVLTSVAGGGTGSDWSVSCVTPVADNDGDGVADCPGAGVVPTEIQLRPATEGSRNVVVTAGQATIVFGATGRVTPVPAAAISIGVSNPTGGTCATAGGKMRCLNVIASTGGQVRMCDPALASTDPRGC